MQNVFIFLLKRIDFIVDLELGTQEMRDHPQKYEHKGKYNHVMDWLKSSILKILNGNV